ncbi:uncharacterized protein TOL2_C43330 [Desulfobacula toluolica Tol2]|uniref:Uncharacterized protein n=1 Tax=Desulfobacula toluolica (strain DSM 7467 / Tol2) TaxID=651182 RepID=K0ND25_DESTT|nr:uncharacterized protein TOL2_C43330 [Desulfobacula toluolica Tol2]
MIRKSESLPENLWSCCLRGLGQIKKMRIKTVPISDSF